MSFYYNKVKDVVLLSIYYNGKRIVAVYNGFTEYVCGNEIPYLKTVESSWDTLASSYLCTKEKSSILLWNTLGLSVDDTHIYRNVSKDESGLK